MLDRGGAGGQSPRADSTSTRCRPSTRASPSSRAWSPRRARTRGALCAGDGEPAGSGTPGRPRPQGQGAGRRQGLQEHARRRRPPRPPRARARSSASRTPRGVDGAEPRPLWPPLPRSHGSGYEAASSAGPSRSSSRSPPERSAETTVSGYPGREARPGQAEPRQVGQAAFDELRPLQMADHVLRHGPVPAVRATPQRPRDHTDDAFELLPGQRDHVVFAHPLGLARRGPDEAAHQHHVARRPVEELGGDPREGLDTAMLPLGITSPKPSRSVGNSAALNASVTVADETSGYPGQLPGKHGVDLRQHRPARVGGRGHEHAVGAMRRPHPR